MNTVYIALGSNISRREDHLKHAIEMLDQQNELEVIQKSSIYETAPVGYTEQNDFLNMVIQISTTLSPFQLLNVCQSVEADLGRRRVVKWGPRTIDLDILLFNQENMETERLIIPHPSMQDRAFVMVPLAEIAPQVIIPGLNQTAQMIINELPEQDKSEIRVWGRI
ncbi:2-amino-4-hydroxy-6-hydroxymethyldihydropteridine diphosphokinase [Halobacillus yeomjeoni]|uniref:2-amino-4-hydroxy-6-hydroxymethyldihydropteridine diphosphokinase n=1 Tax=Halobacillus yeomjeoni TaxID=311194 RepID=A0A931HY34_9BACI|nr:2-amino-4-hydroxy-6-hydroxymethyldihydropteridine diphosphokinase [Halobacillus yeomjeoni]MBH0231815.1 2-amino-4-hydroxy-6-hydroxymethyldihydropteridine diphosphokinase [Halobacillus yeomjeoni]